MYEKGDLLGRVMEIILPKFQLVCVLNDARVFTYTHVSFLTLSLECILIESTPFRECAGSLNYP